MAQKIELKIPPPRMICKTSTLPHQNEYTRALEGEFSKIAFSEERAPKLRGNWQEEVFSKVKGRPLDLEIGTGNGTFFADRAKRHPERDLIGIELKYKPLIQTIRRAHRAGSTNVAMIRYHAFNILDLFAEGEINDIFIHFPDPWVAPRKPRNRVVSQVILDILFELQKPGSYLIFKTDSREYFLWAKAEIERTKYEIEFETLDLHKSSEKEKNFETAFERIFLKKGIQINYIRLLKPHL